MRKAGETGGLSLRARMLLLAVLLIVPFFVLTLLLTLRLNEIVDSYDAIVENITKVNAYNLVFRENMDGVVRQMVSGSLSKYDVKQELGMTGPDELIRDAEDAFEDVLRGTVSKEAREAIRQASRLLTSLHRKMDELGTVVRIPEYREQNLKTYEEEIRPLTEQIQDKISEYIYYESVLMGEIRKEMESRRDAITRFAVLAALALAFLSILLTTGLTRTVTGPLKELMEASEEIGHGNFETRVVPGGTPEIRTLGRSFNSMAGRLDDLVERNRQEQIKLRNLELKLLQAQIDPHFLYNTLDNIVWLAEDGRKEDVEGIATSLSTFFRTALSGGRDEILIREEEQHIRSYLEIQQFRYRDMLSYDIEVDPACENCLILKMTLQPVVENAIYHGIKNRRGGGHISIRILGEGARIHIYIDDTGMGMSKEELTELIRSVDGGERKSNDGKHFGLSNVAERLRLNYGESSGLVFGSTQGEGTRVEILIPRIEEPRAGRVEKFTS